LIFLLSPLHRSGKSEGRRSVGESQSRANPPPDLQRALDSEPAALAFYASLDSPNRYAILYRVHDAKKPETRAKRIVDFVRMLARGETLYPPTRARRQ
jgi:uncharacterized protein YdeI (YjbR/CyaY-like superfamily)